MAEITSKVKLSYLKNGAWKSFSSKIQSSIDGLKIQTSNSAYYLQYRTWNQGKTAFYPYVKSTVNDYAGMDGRPVQLLQIQALKSDGTQLDSGIVVMFRTYTDGKWLPWVSNADPKWMESVQKKYKLGGTLDTSGAYAGLSGKNAAGVEIRVFEEGPLGNFEGGEVKAGFSYMADSESNWTEFSSAALAPYMDGIKIQTPTNKGYYLTYKTWNEGKENYYPAVKSTVNDYAGVPGRHIQRLAISAYKNDGTVLTSGVIVMYRAFVDGRWLPWVSNADAQWMRSIKEKHELDGTLDTSSGYAGISGKNLGGVEIRIFEDDAPNAGSDRFEGDEIPLELGYIANNNTWHSFTKSVKASPMDGIKIQTSASDFYLAYKTWNEGKGNYYPEVKSTENDYAGMAGRPIQRVSISACSADGTRLDSGVVVMYRAFVDGRWLPWVSNAGAEHMKNVQSRFNLDGTLDTISNYAGISGKNIAGLEIRAFKGELDEGIQDLPGTESTPAMSYMYSNIWQSFPGSILHDPIEGVKIQTASSKPYYFTYKTWNEGKTWYYPAVKSTEDDYAGMSGRPIQRLNIQVFRNDGTALESGVVVMYRVYVEGRWLPWVSNATREWMQSVQDKYQLDGTLDSTGTYAGISGKNISGLEIRVYEENQITDTPITPTGKHKIIDVDFITQIGKYPTGCESVTAVMALHHNGINISVKDFINQYLDMQPYPFDPFETFGGDPFSNNGWGCYAPVIKKALDRALAGRSYYTVKHDGVSLQKLCTDYIDKNIPVILWATMGMRASKTITWTYNGRRIEWVQPEHCLLLVGYDEKHYIFNDPQKSRPLTYYTKESVEKAYKAQFSQAVVILQKGSKYFGDLGRQGYISDDEVIATDDGFYMSTISLSTILAKEGIKQLVDEKDQPLSCAMYLDDWYLFSVPDTYGLVKMREQESDGEDGDDPGVTISFVTLHLERILNCLINPSEQNKKELWGEVRNVTEKTTTETGERMPYDVAMFNYFKNPASKAPYLIAERYISFIASTARDGVLEEPRAYKEVLERRDSLAEVISSPQFGLYNPAVQAEYMRFHKRAERIPNALISNNEKAGYDIYRDGKIYLKDPTHLTKFEKYAILILFTADVTFNSFAAEVKFHADALDDFLAAADRYYFATLRADMATDMKVIDGTFDEYYDLNGPLVQEQIQYHGEY